MDHQESMQTRLALQHAAFLEERDKAFEEGAPDIIWFKKYFKDEHNIELSDHHFEYVETIGLLLVYPKVIHLLIPERKDKEGLYDFSVLMTKFTKSVAAKGVFKGPRYFMFATSLFRRGFNNRANFQPGFLNKFWNYDNKLVKALIALDEDRIKINPGEATYMEFDRWYGPKFNSDIKTIPDDIVKLAPPVEINTKFKLGAFADAYALDIKWYSTVHLSEVDGKKIRTPIKAFQAEEFKQDYITMELDGQIVHPVRYVHAEYDLEKGTFQHFDGALHFYTPDEYLIRRDEDFHYNLKHDQQIKTRSEKLFKFNGPMSVEDWVSFCGLFLLQNPLIIEYFEGKLPDEILSLMEGFRLMDQDDQTN